MKRRSGVVVSELIMGFILLTVFIVFSLAIYANAVRNLREMQSITIANSLLINEVEKVKITEYDDLVDDSDTVTISRVEYTIILDVDEEEYDPDDQVNNDEMEYKEVDITVSYTLNGKQESTEAETLKINKE